MAMPREQKQADKSKSFEQQTGKSAFSPTLRSKRTDIMMWCDQGKNEDQILAMVGSGVSRDELKRFMQANNMQIKQLRPHQR